MFDGLQELHSLGFVHRDVKPANYSIGLGVDKRRVFLVDLGMTTSYPTEERQLEKKSKYKFIGTLRYAPRTTHYGKRQSRKDDLEAWLYTSLEMFTGDILPWRHVEDDKEVARMKEASFKDPTPLMTQMPLHYADIFRLIEKTQPLQSPDYRMIRETLIQIARDENTCFDDPFEWEEGARKVPTMESVGTTVGADCSARPVKVDSEIKTQASKEPQEAYSEREKTKSERTCRE
uniref:Protein kinase domain-containing protein n=1 Tax=Steinernema glaseri TaxID=37863 RepID=A0A1I7Y9T3_9BILA